MADHDHSYKQLFSNPELIRDLLKDFILEDWVKDLDLHTLERVSGSYVTDDLRERENDIIWRVRLGSSWLYVYLLIEFQSTVDKFMALRLLNYLTLLYQDLQKTDNLSPDGKLPPVLPLVLYNGQRKWNAPIHFSELIQDITGGLSKYRPDFRYLLLEENLYNNEDLPTRNLVSAVFKLEKSRNPEDMRELVSTLIVWLKAPDKENIRRSFAVWINRVLLPLHMPGQEIPNLKNLLEIEWKKEGMREGISDLLHQQMTQKFGTRP
jgi:predicted transposase/invertase (TIGR01784 family)